MPTIAKDIWTTREGQQLEISKMASSHLLSAIHFIERSRLLNASDVYDRTKATGDTLDAMGYYLQWPVQYESLVAEAQRRGLIYRGVEGLVKK